MAGAPTLPGRRLARGAPAGDRGLVRPSWAVALCRRQLARGAPAGDRGLVRPSRAVTLGLRLRRRGYSPPARPRLRRRRPRVTARDGRPTPRSPAGPPRAGSLLPSPAAQPSRTQPGPPPGPPQRHRPPRPCRRWCPRRALTCRPTPAPRSKWPASSGTCRGRRTGRATSGTRTCRASVRSSAQGCRAGRAAPPSRRRRRRSTTWRCICGAAMR